MSEYSEHRMESQMGVLLRAGVIVACSIMLVGGVLFLLQHGAAHESYQAFRGEPAPLRSVAGIWREVLAGNARGLIQFSVLVLIATPVLRVVFAVYGFTRQKQWMYVAVSLVVLVLLAVGLSEHG